MKVLILEFHQESNSFCPVRTTMQDYLRCSVLEGDDFRRKMKGEALAPNGMFTALEEAGAVSIPGYAMRAPAGGPVEHQVLEHFLTKARRYVVENLPLDGVLVSLHGATQTTEEDDACGRILQELRAMSGPDTVISASLDLHANVTERMCRNADFLCGYLTYPHVDVYETGYRAAKLAIRAMQGEELCMVRIGVPMIVPASGYTTQSGAFACLVREARRLVQDRILEDYSIFQVQPWLDVSDGSGAVLTVARDSETARRCGKELAEKVYALREQMQPELFTVEEVIDRAERNTSDRPIIAVDFSDSTNAGAAGDNADILEALLKAGKQLKTAFVLIDRPAVEAAFTAGVGAELDLTLGGTRDASSSRKVPLRVRVRSLHDGDFQLEGPSMRGVMAHVGKTAHLSSGNMDIIVCQAMTSTGDPQLYRHFGVEPTLYQMVVVKACNSFRAAYEPMAQEICLVDTHCAATADLKCLPFKKLKRDIYPFIDGGNAQ